MGLQWVAVWLLPVLPWTPLCTGALSTVGGQKPRGSSAGGPARRREDSHRYIMMSLLWMGCMEHKGYTLHPINHSIQTLSFPPALEFPLDVRPVNQTLVLLADKGGREWPQWVICYLYWQFPFRWHWSSSYCITFGRLKKITSNPDV